MKLEDRSVCIEQLGPGHDRTAFACGNDDLDIYLRQQAGQDTRRGISRVFVAVFLDRPEQVIGYFTLSAALVTAADLPRELSKRLPRHPIPAALIGRLAVDRRYARRGLGGILLADAIRKTAMAAETVAMTVVIVDPIDEAAKAFYSAYGFRDLQGPQQRMFLALPRDAARW